MKKTFQSVFLLLTLALIYTLPVRSQTGPVMGKVLLATECFTPGEIEKKCISRVDKFCDESLEQDCLSDDL